MGLRLCLLASALALTGCSPAGATEVLSVSAANADNDPAAEPVVETSGPASVAGAAGGVYGLLPFLAPSAPVAPGAPLTAGFIRAEALNAEGLDAGALDAKAARAAIPQAPVPQGVFSAAQNPPLPPARPDFGDRVRTAAASPTRPETARSANLPPLQIVAFAKGASLAAYEFKEAGIPLPAGALRPQQANLARESFELPDTMKPDNAAARAARSGKGWRAAYGHVVTRCFPQDLRRALDRIAGHFNAEVLVTSGHRTRGRRGSLHRSCKAADIRVTGVPASEVARFARNIPGVNGVGLYRRIGLTHIDVRSERSSWTW